MPGNFAEFGPEALGARLAEQDYAKSISGSIGDLMHLAQTQEADARLPLIQAEARKTGAEADALVQKADVQRKMAAMLANRGGGPATSGNLAFDLADIAGASGDPDAATKYLLRGTQIETAKATQGWREAQTDTQKLDQIRRVANLTSSMALGVTDQASYDRFLLQAPSLGLSTDQFPSDFASGKAHLDEVVRQGMTAKQAADVAISTRLRDQQEKVNAATIRARDAQISANDARTKVLKQQLKAVEQNDGERSQAALERKQELTKLAKSRRTLIDQQTAGLTADNPRPLPLAEGKANADALKPGQFYTNSKGQVGRWNGKGMELVQPGKIVVAPPPDDTDALGDDNADED